MDNTFKIDIRVIGLNVSQNNLTKDTSSEGRKHFIMETFGTKSYYVEDKHLNACVKVSSWKVDMKLGNYKMKQLILSTVNLVQTVMCSMSKLHLKHLKYLLHFSEQFFLLPTLKALLKFQNI